jgi:hypothetical protein
MVVCSIDYLPQYYVAYSFETLHLYFLSTFCRLAVVLPFRFLCRYNLNLCSFCSLLQSTNRKKNIVPLLLLLGYFDRFSLHVYIQIKFNVVRCFIDICVSYLINVNFFIAFGNLKHVNIFGDTFYSCQYCSSMLALSLGAHLRHLRMFC